MRSGQSLLKRGCYFPERGGDLAKVADLRCLRSHPVHAPCWQDCVGIFEELGVVQQRPDGLVQAAPFDGSQVEVQAWPGERFIGLEYGDVLGKAADEFLYPLSQPTYRASRLTRPPLATDGHQGGRGLTAVGGHIDKLASRPGSPHDEPIRSELSADHVDIDPVHLRGLSDLIII